MEKLGILFITFFITIYSQIKNNPIFLDEGGYPLVLSAEDNDYYYVITRNKGLKIEKESGKIVETNDTIHIESKNIYIVDNSNHNNYILDESNECSLINYNPFSTSKMNHFSSLDIEGVENINKIGTLVQDDDFIIYGFYDDQLFFSSKSQQSHSSISIDQINDKLSCKFIAGEIFVCAIAIDNRVDLFCLKYENKDSLTRLENSFSINEVMDSSKIALYDTTNIQVKIICFIKIQSDIICRFLHIETEDGEHIEFNFIGEESSNFSPPDDFSESNCYFSEFNSEYLFYCSTLDAIYCWRINKDSYGIIRYFKIESFGQNSHLTIKSNNDFITLFYMNNNENGVHVYEYYMYLPICQNRNYTILNSINWNKSENDMEKLSDLFIVKTNNYFFSLINPPYEYGYFTLNNTQIERDIPILDNNYILDFFVDNSKNITEEIIYIVEYSVYVGDYAYSTECQIGLTIKPCYITCETCSKDYSESDNEHHNCIRCKNNYYFSTENNGNCYPKEQEIITSNFDIDITEFINCNEKCKTCSGPTEYDCITCFDQSYLENGSCKDNCSEGYFPKISDKGDFFECSQCYENCKTCFQEGDIENMECETCKEEYIKYEKKCYHIEDQTKKYFYDPESDDYESSCYKKFNLYIKENSNECIDFPGNDEGYYISNPDTGVLSKCHENCLSCEYGPKYNELNYLESMECTKCNNLQNNKTNMIKVDNNCFKIIQYEDNQIIFNISEMTPDNPLGSCLYFDKAIYYGQYECIDKPNNTYFVIDNNSNTGVIKNCHEACNFCVGDGNDDNTNCIECTNDYVKAENSDTNCVKKESMSQNINSVIISTKCFSSMVLLLLSTILSINFL